MKVSPLTFWASSIALFGVPGVLAQPTGTETSSASTATASEEPSCTASLIAELCEYKKPGPEFAVASSGKAHCWDYCNDHQPCNFVVFVAGNPYTGTGTCWLYPDEDYDESAGTAEGCSNRVYHAYDKPECEESENPTATTTSGAAECAATESPSAIAEVCDYPDPGRDCFYDCYASSSASNCLSICAEKDECNYVVFNPHNPSNTPHAGGTCWVYAEGKYNHKDASDCKGEPEQWVYENKCPKPKRAPSSSSSSSESSATESDGESATAAGSEDDGDEDAASAPSAFSLAGLLALGLALF